jgi:acyl-CoA synthetase
MASSSDAGADILAEMQKILGSGSEWMKQSDDFFFAGGASPDVIVLAQTLGVPAEVVVRHRTAAAIAAAIAEPSAEVMPSSSGEIDVLPAEVLHRILAFVPLKEQLSVMRLVCKSWRKAVDDTPAPLIQDETEQQAPQGTLVRMWSAHLGRCVDATPLLSKRYTVRYSRTYIGSHSQEVCCLDPDGQVVWKKELPGRIEATIVFGKGVVGRSRRGDEGSQLIVPCLDGKVYCLDENTGEILWQYDTGGEVKCGLALTDCGSRLETSTSLDQRPRAVHVPGYRLLWGQSHSGSAFAIAASGPHAGKAIWRYENSGPGVVEPVVDDTYDTQQDVFFANLKGDVFVVYAHAVSKDWMEHGPDGIKEAKEYVAWSTNVGAPVFSTPSVDFQGSTVQGMTFPIIVANVDGLVFGLDRDNGQKVWTVDLGCKIYAPIYSDTEEIGGDFAAKVLIGTADGELVLLRRQQYGLPNPNLGEEKREVADDEFYMTEVWRWKGRGGLRAGPVFINTGKRQVDNIGVFVAAWDSGEISVFSYSDVKNDRLPRHLSTGRLPAPIFGTPVFGYDDRFFFGLSKSPARLPLGDVRIYVGCRDDRLHCLKLSGVRRRA